MLEVKDLHAYYGKSHILQGVDMHIDAGEVVSLLGRNGVGRSTTVKAKRTGRVTLSKLVGKTVRKGGKIEIRVTLAKTGTGIYRFGATGSYFRWTVEEGKLSSRFTGCLNVKSGKNERCPS